jgi:hypothetical protein
MSDETPQERALDEATREAGWEELDKEEQRESLRTFGRSWRFAPLGLFRWPSLKRPRRSE